MNRRDLLRRAATLPFIGGVGAAIAARPQVITFEPLKRATEWATEMGWKVIRYPEQTGSDSYWWAWIEDKSGRLVGWISSGGDFRIAPK